MAKLKKKNLIVCAYCRNKIRHCDSQRDHIPPKSLFNSPRPSNLVTVRCCATCHKNLSDGDEPLRSYAALSWGTTESARGLKEITKRAHDRDPWWYAELRKCVKSASPIPNPYHSSKSIYETIITGNIAESIHRTLIRTARGLLFHQNPDFDTREINFKLFQSKPIKLEHFVETACGLGPLRFLKTFGNNAFAARWDYTIEDERCGVMIMTFFGRLNFTIFFGPPKIR